MDTVEIVIGEDGRIVSPQGVRLRLPSRFVVRDEPEEDREARAERLQAVFDKIDADLEHVPLKPWPLGDPIVEKYRRKGLID